MRLPFLARRVPTPADLAPVPVPAAPKPATAPGPVPVPAALTPPPTPPADTPAPRFQPGRYVVRYDRFGQHGVPGPDTLTLVADSAADLAEQIRTDIAPFLGSAHRIEVTVDTVVSGGLIRYGWLTGTFTFARGGAR